ncbi:MAG: hypothetical protein HOK24_15070 [Desulfobacula sp.]|nr:hypothetical protein [Desulfobacula sp.]
MIYDFLKKENNMAPGWSQSNRMEFSIDQPYTRSGQFALDEHFGTCCYRLWRA